MRGDAVLKKGRGLIVIFLSLTLITVIAAGYGIAQLTDVIWTYSDSSRTVEATEFGDGDTVYVKVTDLETKGGAKAITVANNTIGNTISVNVTDSNQDSFYLGYFIIYSGINDDANDKLGLLDGQAATITADLANDGTAGTSQITADYGPRASITCNPSPIIENTEVAVTLETSEDVIQVPTPLIITFSDASTSDITLTGAVPGSIFTGSFAVTDEVPDGQATFSLAEGALLNLYGVSGNTITSGKIILINRVAPPAPSTLTAIVTEDDKIKLTWTVLLEENITQYNVYRGTYSGGEDFTAPVGIVTASGQSSYEWLDSNVVLGTTYYYVVRTERITGQESLNSPEASAGVTTQLLSLGFQRPSVVRSDRPIKIILRVRQPANISIRIFNLNGKIVYDWSDYISSGEEKEWTWNGVNMYGEEVNNGVYIWRIEAKADGGTSDSKTKIFAVLR